VGEIVGVGLIAHVPTMVLPRDVRLEINGGRDITLIDGITRIRRQVLDELRPDTVIVFDSHWFTTVEFCVTSHGRRSGLMTSDELPRGMCQVPYDIRGDPRLAHLMAEEVNAAIHQAAYLFGIRFYKLIKTHRPKTGVFNIRRHGGRSVGWAYGTANKTVLKLRARSFCNLSGCKVYLIDIVIKAIIRKADFTGIKAVCFYYVSAGLQIFLMNFFNYFWLG